MGVLHSRDQIVLVAAAGAHRGSTFAAAEFVMDYLKSTATIWKKEVTTEGETWLGLKASDEHATKRWDANN